MNIRMKNLELRNVTKIFSGCTNNVHICIRRIACFWSLINYSVTESQNDWGRNVPAGQLVPLSLSSSELCCSPSVMQAALCGIISDIELKLSPPDIVFFFGYEDHFLEWYWQFRQGSEYKETIIVRIIETMTSEEL